MVRAVLFLLSICPLLLAAQVWQIKFSEALTLEQAKTVSTSGTVLPGSKSVNVKDGTICHLSKLSGKIPKRSKLRAIAFTSIDSKEECERYIGIGVDWYFTCFVNGKKVLSTEPGGNIFTRISPYNHIAKVKLKKGKNFIALYIRPLVYQWKFAFKFIPYPDMLPKHQEDRERMLAHLFPPKNPGLLRKELLHQVSVDSAAISCEFGTPTICGIRYRKRGSQQNTLLWNTISGKRAIQKIHRFHLTSLAPSTAYDYEIVKIDVNTAGIIPVSSGSFTTNPASGVQNTFMIISDTQVAPETRKNAVASMLKLPEAKNADFVVSLGDVAEHFDNFGFHYFDCYLDELHRNKWFKPVMIVRGNHEYRGNDTMVFPEHFGRTYYSFRHGDIFFIVLDTGEGADTIWKPGNHLLWTDTSQLFAEQINFLDKIIDTPECKNAKYRIVISHASPFRYHAKFYAGSVRKLTEKFFFGANPRCKIDLWLCAHVHYASRFDPVTKTMVGFPFPKRKDLKIDAADLADINFSVITNDGPGQGGEQLSVTTVKITPAGINVTITTPDGKIIDDSFIQKGKAHTVKKTVLQKL